MSYDFYKIFHLSLIFLSLLCLGALAMFYGLLNSNEISKKDIKNPILGLYGLATFIIFVAGLGLIVKLRVPWPWPVWVYAKMILWFILAASPVFLRKNLFLPFVAKLPSHKKVLVYFLFLMVLLFLAVFSVRMKF